MYTLTKKEFTVVPMVNGRICEKITDNAELRVIVTSSRDAPHQNATYVSFPIALSVDLSPVFSPRVPYGAMQCAMCNAACLCTTGRAPTRLLVSLVA